MTQEGTLARGSSANLVSKVPLKLSLPGLQEELAYHSRRVFSEADNYPSVVTEGSGVWKRPSNSRQGEEGNRNWTFRVTPSGSHRHLPQIVVNPCKLSDGNRSDSCVPSVPSLGSSPNFLGPLCRTRQRITCNWVAAKRKDGGK